MVCSVADVLTHSLTFFVTPNTKRGGGGGGLYPVFTSSKLSREACTVVGKR